MINPKYIPYRFQYLRPVGFIPKKFATKINEQPFKQNIDTISMSILNRQPTQAIVQVTKENLEKALYGYDRPESLPDNPHFKLAIEYFMMYLRNYIPQHKPQYHSLYVKMNTSPGYPWNLYYSDKNSVDPYLLSEVVSEKLGRKDVIWQLNMKKETLPITKILDNKMRSYVMAPDRKSVV